jgi:formamidopyrimidine-DNA glycosylase
MAGRILVDGAAEGRPGDRARERRAEVWDRFTLDFEDGGKLILRDKRRLGRAVLDPDLSALGPDAAEVNPRRLPQARRSAARRSRRGSWTSP